MQKINGNSLFLPPQRHTFAHKKEKLPHHSGTAVFLFLSYSVFPDDLLRISRWNHRRYHRKMRYGCWNHRYYPHFSVLQILIPYCRGKNHYFWSHSYCPAAHKKPPDPVFAQFSAFFSYFRSPVICHKPHSKSDQQVYPNRKRLIRKVFHIVWLCLICLRDKIIAFRGKLMKRFVIITVT